VKVKFHGAAPDGFVNGAIVRIHGRRTAARSPSRTGRRSRPTGRRATQVLASAPGWSGQRKLAVILVNFSNNATKPFTRTYANGVVFTTATPSGPTTRSSPTGRWCSRGTTFDWIKVPLSSSTCQTGAWATAAKAGLAARGVDLSSFTNFMYIFPHTSACSWGGLGYLPAPPPGSTAFPAFGSRHTSSATTLACTRQLAALHLERRPRGPVLELHEERVRRPVHDHGQAHARHVANLSLTQIGYLPVEASKTVTATGTYVLTSAAASSGVRILSVPRGDGTFFYLEYRRRTARTSTTSPPRTRRERRDHPHREGLDDDHPDAADRHDPSTTTFTDAPLRLAKTFTGLQDRADDLRECASARDRTGEDHARS
jgi:hypothetical protein